MTKIKVALVGAGPGDPDFLTVKGLRLIQEADVLLYDALIDPRVLDEAKDDCQKIYVGKKFKDGQDPMRRQALIHEQMHTFYAQGLRVVRLKAGDPMIFGRGMEEVRYLEDKHIPWEMVPGISAANAASALFGLPITERGKSRMVLFTSAYTESGDSPSADPFLSVLKEEGSVVFYMGLSKLAHLLKEIRRAGISNIHVVIASSVSQKEQKILRGTSENILELLRLNEVEGPSLLMMGKHLL